MLECADYSNEFFSLKKFEDKKSVYFSMTSTLGRSRLRLICLYPFFLLFLYPPATF